MKHDNHYPKHESPLDVVLSGIILAFIAIAEVCEENTEKKHSKKKRSQN